MFLIMQPLPLLVVLECHSASWPLTRGVPQGSLSSPMLFNSYVKLLCEVIRKDGIECHQYADNTQLYNISVHHLIPRSQ